MSFAEQFPIVFGALNEGFLQTLKLFGITLLGALPLGLLISFGTMSNIAPLKIFCKILIWIIRGTPLMIQLLIIYYMPGLI
ncbi:MAG: ABC transporter permease subunit, partial [Parasporobacterium sp.]|nr:ABC transporter permease subunit [Parasporobacterium sp.]